MDDTPLTVLLIEDDPTARNAFEEYAASLNDIAIAGAAADAAKGLDLIRKHLPQVIILDLELHTGRGTGLDVLRGLPDLALHVDPYILVITDSANKEEIEYARSFGVGFFLTKYQGGYSEQYVLDFLRPMREAIQSHYHARRVRVI